MKLLLIGLGVLGATAVSAAPALAAGNAAHGKEVFAQCAACHSFNPAKNDPGPNLKGIVGRKSAAVEDYIYSGAMKRSDVVWDESTLNAYLANPRVVIPRTKMPFAGMPVPEDRADLIAYLKTQ